jgi:hypothetical protein
MVVGTRLTIPITSRSVNAYLKSLTSNRTSHRIPGIKLLGPVARWRHTPPLAGRWGTVLADAVRLHVGHITRLAPEWSTGIDELERQVQILFVVHGLLKEGDGARVLNLEPHLS